MTKQNQKIIVGSEEWCELPLLDIRAVRARVDSGARTCALHAYNIKPFKRNAAPWVSFERPPLAEKWGRTSISERKPGESRRAACPESLQRDLARKAERNRGETLGAQGQGGGGENESRTRRRKRDAAGMSRGPVHTRTEQTGESGTVECVPEPREGRRCLQSGGGV